MIFRLLRNLLGRPGRPVSRSGGRPVRADDDGADRHPASPGGWSAKVGSALITMVLTAALTVPLTLVIANNLLPPPDVKGITLDVNDPDQYGKIQFGTSASDQAIGDSHRPSLTYGSSNTIYVRANSITTGLGAGKTMTLTCSYVMDRAAGQGDSGGDTESGTCNLNGRTSVTLSITSGQAHSDLTAVTVALPDNPAGEADNDIRVTLSGTWT